MNELKTLKDINIGCYIGCCEKINKTIIQNEAIKWIKQIQSGKEVKTEKLSFKWDKLSPYTGAVGAVLIEFIKHFFNIVEEDLK